jgi:hypothetical protein
MENINLHLLSFCADLKFVISQLPVLQFRVILRTVLKVKYI